MTRLRRDYPSVEELFRPENAVGQIKKIHGKQEVQIALYDTFPDQYDMQEPLWVEIDSMAVPLFASRWNERGKAQAIAQIDDFTREAEIELLLGRKIYLPAADETPDNAPENVDELPWKGYRLVDASGRWSGVITACHPHPQNPLVEADGRLIPVAPPLVERVDRRKKELIVHIAEGVLDL